MNHERPAVPSKPATPPTHHDRAIHGAAMLDSSAATEEPPSVTAFTISVRTLQGRILVDVTREALLKLRRPAHDASLLAVLSRHAPKFRAVALQLAHRNETCHVTIDAESVWWRGEDAD
jgi:hypothetical protein